MNLLEALEASPVSMAEAEVDGTFSWVVDGIAEEGKYCITAGVLNMPHTIMRVVGSVGELVLYARERGLPEVWVPVQEGED